jgi:outer membrane protein OmpA-like peptidoglycan-associated protein
VIERAFAPGEREFSLRAEPTERGDDVTVGQRVRVAIAPVTPRNNPPLKAAAPTHTIPAPVTFVYNETTFTNEGRKAVTSLTEYLISRRWDLVSLSGHADERGSDRYNMELSRQRLDAVAAYLRDHGFVGKLELVPKGKSEPYAHVDRQMLPREDALQLDRRVELRLVR